MMSAAPRRGVRQRWRRGLLHSGISGCCFLLLVSRRAALAASTNREAPALASNPAQLPPPTSAPVEFARDVRPLFEKHCVRCHGAEKQKGGLRLDTKSTALKGGDDGRVILPGRSAESRLVQYVAGLDPDKIMPPKGERLSPEQVGLLRAWIDRGAVWPEDGKKALARSDHWSLQPLPSSAALELAVGRRISQEAGPAGGRSPSKATSDRDRRNSESPPQPLDAFILARLATNGLALSPPADPATLIRRLSFDLIGLPPTPAEVDAFVADSSPRAYGKLVERLLASPRYGERWGRHWLDVARYTESQGFEYDKLRENAWHYRDFVIQSFNDDKPYDRFMKEQVAGDVLEPVTAEGIVGASLLVCGPWDEAGNGQANATQRAITREEEMEDMISVVGQTFLGLTINCARCHSHKFDPIPQEEYYRIKSVFEGVKHGERAIANGAETAAHAERIAALKREIAAAQDRVSRLEGEGGKVAAARRRSGTAEPGPVPFAQWAFDDSSTPAMPGELKGGAVIANGRLRLGAEGAYYQTAPIPRDLREKTLEAWVALADLKQGGGAALSVESEDGRVFDAIVFGERQSRKWMAGSSGFERTQDLEGLEETAAPGELVHMAVVYRSDNSIAVFRNGEPYGKPYTPGSPLQTFAAGKSRLLLGRRHTGGSRAFLTGEIRQAALYDRALGAEEVAASFRAAGFSIPRAEVLAALDETQRAEHAAALEEMRRLREELDGVKPLPVSYAGTRVQPAPTKLLRRGDVKSPGETVTPAGLSAIVDLESEFGLPADAAEAQRRLKFAEWLADPRNPLPARVMANRVWHLHFGQGLVATPNDFGVSGARPTHPELLDWLAARFIESGWSVKALHRLIVNSATYRQSSDGPGMGTTGERRGESRDLDSFRRAAALDADNQLLWRFLPHRLEAEAVRDAVLAVSGQLNLEMGGPSFRPFEVLKFPANAYLPVDKAGAGFSRRTVYRMNVNSGKEPLLDAFDCPDPSVKTPRRGVTTTPLQALALMNNSFVQRHAAHLAARACRESNDDLPRAVRTAYRLALGRAPTEAEAARALAVARERSLTNVCWALLNSTEFIYVR